MKMATFWFWCRDGQETEQTSQEPVWYAGLSQVPHGHAGTSHQCQRSGRTAIQEGQLEQVWPATDSSQGKQGTQEEGQVMGGKPSKGTKKDKRLKENKRTSGSALIGRLAARRRRS